uniref:Uncharacterized protein n=1 Tax=Nelumbo nucifera TaxID=4432 RepID=A0A822ZH02_NELNU|nr:TPA_asm: hypothetical protein HUJ06_002133 [Nelumbo nucifera]
MSWADSSNEPNSLKKGRWDEKNGPPWKEESKFFYRKEKIKKK